MTQQHRRVPLLAVAAILVGVSASEGCTSGSSDPANDAAVEQDGGAGGSGTGATAGMGAGGNSGASGTVSGGTGGLGPPPMTCVSRFGCARDGSQYWHGDLFCEFEGDFCYGVGDGCCYDYCDRDTDCIDPDRPFCRQLGQFSESDQWCFIYKMVCREEDLNDCENPGLTRPKIPGGR